MQTTRAFFRRTIRAPFAYAAAFFFVGAGLLLSRYAPAAPSPVLPLLIFSAAVAASGAAGGRGPAILSTLLALACADYFFIPTAGTLKVPYTRPDIFAFGAFCGAAALVTW